MHSDTTTIKIKKSTKKRLEGLRVYSRETYEEIISKLLDILNLCKMNPEMAKRQLYILDKQRKNSLRKEKLINVIEEKTKNEEV
ncbi:hypothetical protein J4461_00140 [Candidatus Pacearchaeota archaeon]|nr:hypothetical protein [Candidatus Pacearchaeota archaeon]